MKKLFAVLLVLVCLVSSLPAWATETEKKPEVFTSGDYKYTILEDGTAEIKKYSGTSKELEIPASLDGIAVTSIGVSAFEFCRSL